jgi:hypothetical protein
MPRRKSRKGTIKGGKQGNVNPSITQQLTAIDKAIDDILAISEESMNEIRPSFVAVKRMTVHMIRSDDTYPLPTLVTYHDSCIRIFRTIRGEIDHLFESETLDEDTVDYLDERVSTIMSCLTQLKTLLPRGQPRTRPRSRSRSRNRQV